MQSSCSIYNGLLFGLIMNAQAALAGWSIGGGEIPSTASNPWFLQSQDRRDVSYCVKIDEQNFGVTEAAGLAAIRKALDYWKAELAEFEVNPFKIDYKRLYV